MALPPQSCELSGASGEAAGFPLAKAGRKTPYRNMSALAVPSTLAIPTCDNCGNEWIDPQTADALDEALETAYAEELHKRLEAALVAILKADVTQRRLEQILGLSVGYLSRVRAKRGDASAPRCAARCAVR